ncbi:glycosyl hydrolase 2 galactose-binding domain-containing protein [Pseudalkalibacillus sp. A8]|uniref:beta-mannosidase n=1 Tax=Pseudalkalibacillus sp. A8 TaxID=3382641 RepID=UPI0038B69843
MNRVSSDRKSAKDHKVVLTDWKFKQADERNWMPATVPGSVHTDLLSNQQITDPFYGRNELELQWIDKKDWEYETVFDVPDDVFRSSHVELVFHGLDTYADVYLNDTKILSADNMFRSWKVDTKGLLQEKDNRLRVYFRSPINEDLVKLDNLGYNLPAVNDHSEDGGVGEKNLSVFARKAPYHYGWDWGPRFVTSGFWKPVELNGWSEARITDLFIDQKTVTAEMARITGVVEVEAEADFEGTLKFSTDGVFVEEQVQLVKGLNEVEVQMDIAEPQLWWSRGLGEQHLYEFTAVLLKEEREVAAKEVRTGLRTIRLVQEKDEAGKSFYFEVNGVPIFAKGANHIPNDSFVTEVTYERYKHEILSAVESNMNMLRVWGGGIYEYDEFYELCDEYGILVWQDFMFACSMYPGDEAFLENIRHEAEENVKRLRNHPSLALWCGNNEMDTAWSQYDEDGGWGWKQQYSPKEREEIWQAYDYVFHDILPEAVKQYSSGTDYWPSSPMADWSGDENQHAHNQSTSGDIHYWDVWHGLKPFEDYNENIGRFMSEYGFQSFPEYETVKTFAETEDMALDSEVMLHHQKIGRGNFLIKEYMEKYLPNPVDFEGFLYMSQVLQAEGIKSAIEAHRRKKPFCMGTLYWQMNDCWPVASWSSMDYEGRWKALHYQVRKSFQDVMLSIDGTDSSKVDIHVISDLLSYVEGELHIQLLDFEGNVLKEKSSKVDVKPNSGKVVLRLSTEELLEGFDRTRTVLEALIVQDGNVIDRKEHYFVSVKDLELSSPEIIVTESDDGVFYVDTNVLAKQVWLSSETEGIFSDNYFDLIPGQKKKVQFYSRDGSDGFVAGSPGKITVRSMADIIVI